MPMPIPADRPIRWGVMGCGGIARTVVQDLRLVPGNELRAVAAARPGAAAAFAQTWGAAGWHGSYAELAARDDIDVVYIATTHERHAACAELALAAGKAVLCEKPVTLDAAAARTMGERAARADRFLMEAMWTRFIPAVRALLDDLPAIGGARMVQADFGIKADGDPQGRMLNPTLGGGALLDLGIYPVTFAMLMVGARPSAVRSLARMHATGVDAGSAYLLGFPGGEQALLMSACDLPTPHQARIHGPLGRIVVDDFFHPTAYTVHAAGAPPRRVELPFSGHGYEFELAEVARCLRAGLRESPLRPWSQTLAVMEVLDELRRPWGLRYPGE